MYIILLWMFAQLSIGAQQTQYSCKTVICDQNLIPDDF